MLPNQDPPAGWPKPRRSATRVLTVAGFSLLALITAALVVSAVITGEIAEALIFAVVTLMFAHLVGMSVSTMRRPAPATDQPPAGVTDQGERGLAFPYSRWAYYWLTAVLVMVVLFLAGFAVAFAATGKAVAWVMAAVFAAGALFLVWFLVVVLRLAPGVVVVTPSGIYHRSLAFEHFVPWDAVVDVKARESRNPWITVKALPTSTTRERRHTGRLGPGVEGLPFMVVRAHWLGANALPAYLTIKRYFENPGERPRLADIALRAGR
jgi:hypothetical protein